MENIVKGIININHKPIIEVFMEVYFKIIIKRSTIFIGSQIANQLGIFLISERRYIISFTKVQEMLKIVRSLWPTFKAF